MEENQQDKPAVWITGRIGLAHYFLFNLVSSERYVALVIVFTIEFANVQRFYSARLLIFRTEYVTMTLPQIQNGENYIG